MECRECALEVHISTHAAPQEDTEELLAEMRGVLTGQARAEPCGEALSHKCAYGHEVRHCPALLCLRCTGTFHAAWRGTDPSA